MSARRRVLIVRHGETEWNAEGRWQGWRDIPLSDRGREQAAQLGRRLAGQTFELDAAAGDVLIVAHGGVNRLLLGRLLGRPLSAFWHLSQDPTAVNVVELPAGPAADALPLARVCLINCTAHLL